MDAERISPRVESEAQTNLIGRALTLGALYGVVAYTCLHFTRFGAPIESVWLSNAIAIAFLVSAPRREWPVLIAMAAIAHITAHTIAGDPPSLTIANVAADMSECVLASVLYTARPSALTLRTRPDVWYFLLVSAGVPLLSALMAAVDSDIAGVPMSPYDMFMWYGADALALIVFLPIIRGAVDTHWRAQLVRRPVHMVTFVLLVIFACVVGAVLINVPTLRMLIIPLLVMAAFDLGVVGAQVNLAVTAVVWVTLTVLGHGPVPWVVTDPREHIVVVQIFIAIFASSVLPLAVALEEKQRLTETLADTLDETRNAWGAIIAAEARYRLIVDYATEMVMRVAPNGAILFASPPCDALAPGVISLENQNLFDFMHREDVEDARANLAQVIDAKLYDLPQHWVYILHKADGSWAEFDARATLVAPGGKLPGEFVFALRARA